MSSEQAFPRELLKQPPNVRLEYFRKLTIGHASLLRAYEDVPRAIRDSVLSDLPSWRNGEGHNGSLQVPQGEMSSMKHNTIIRSAHADKQLLRPPAPQPDESLMGYILRLSETNYYDTPKWILDLAGLKIYSLKMGWRKLCSEERQPM